MTHQAHRIADISYSRDRLVCTCGEVMRADPLARAWDRHRRELGLKVQTIGQTIGRRLAPKVGG